MFSAECKYCSRVGWAPGSHLDFSRISYSTQVNTGVGLPNVQYVILKLHTNPSCNGHLN